MSLIINGTNGISFNDGSTQSVGLTNGTQTIAGAKTFSTSIDAPVITEGGQPVPRMVLATAQNTTSGTAIDFNSIPSWVKRITVMFQGVSSSGTSRIVLRIGSGTYETTGYVSTAVINGLDQTETSGFQACWRGDAANVIWGAVTLTNMGSNTWVQGGSTTAAAASANSAAYSGGRAISGTLDRLRLTTVNGTDTFDAGSVNLLLEG